MSPSEKNQPVSEQKDARSSQQHASVRQRQAAEATKSFQIDVNRKPASIKTKRQKRRSQHFNKSESEDDINDDALSAFGSLASFDETEFPLVQYESSAQRKVTSWHMIPKESAAHNRGEYTRGNHNINTHDESETQFREKNAGVGADSRSIGENEDTLLKQAVLVNARIRAEVEHRAFLQEHRVVSEMMLSQQSEKSHIESEKSRNKHTKDHTLTNNWDGYRQSYDSRGQHDNPIRYGRRHSDSAVAPSAGGESIDARYCSNQYKDAWRQPVSTPIDDLSPFGINTAVSSSGNHVDPSLVYQSRIWQAIVKKTAS